MKKTNLRSLLLLVTLSFANMLFAQQVLKMTQDAVLSNSFGDTIMLFCNSTLRIKEVKNYVRITDVSDKIEENRQVGIFQGAELECKDDSVDDLSKLKFIDNTGSLRSNVKGVGSNLKRIKKYEVEINYESVLVPEDICSIEEQDGESPNVKDEFSYSSCDSTLHVNALHDYKVVVNNKIKKCKKNQEEIFSDVDPGSIIRVIFSNDGECFLDFEVRALQLKKYDPAPELGNIIYVVAGILLVTLIVILIWFLFKRKRKAKKTDEMIFANNVNIKPIEINKHEEVNLHSMKHDVADVRQKVEDVLKTLDLIDGELEKYNKQNKANDLLKEKDKEIEKLKSEIKGLEDKYNSLDKTSEERIKGLNERISGLEQALHVDGAIALNGTFDFVAKTSELMAIGRKAEQKIADFVSRLSDNDANKFAYFIKQYATSMDAEKRDRWNKILSTLSIKGYINDADAIKYLQAKGCESDDAKIDWLKKFIYQEFLQNYLSSLIVMLESIRFAKKYGLSTDSDVSNEIKQLISASKNVGIKIHYVELGKDVDDYSNFEIGSKLPKGVETSCDKNIPVLVTRYGMSSDKSETKSKTEIIILD